MHKEGAFTLLGNKNTFFYTVLENGEGEEKGEIREKTRKEEKLKPLVNTLTS